MRVLIMITHDYMTLMIFLMIMLLMMSLHKRSDWHALQIEHASRVSHMHLGLMDQKEHIQSYSGIQNEHVFRDRTYRYEWIKQAEHILGIKRTDIKMCR